MPRALLASSVATLAVVLSACSWSVPADPGLNAARRSPQALAVTGPGGPPAGRTLAGPGADDPAARGLFVQHCGRCHALPAPSHASAAAWPGILRRMAPRAGLFGPDRRRVERWLVANAP